MNFFLELLVISNNGLNRKKIWLISKFMTSQTDKQTIAIHILTSISRSKKKQGMKFGQLIKNSMRRIFLEKSYTKCGEGTIPRPFF